MNKKLLALAIASAVSLPALADSSNVQIYGLLDAGVDSVTNVYNAGTSTQLNPQTDRVGRVSDYGSRIGIKGSEDLSNGFAGVWQVEEGISINGGNGTNNSYGNTQAFGGVGNSGGALAGLYNSFAGIANKDFGTVLIGKHDTPYKESTARMDPFQDTLGDYNGLVGSSALANFNATNAATFGTVAGATGFSASNYFDQRPANIVDYISPDFVGFSFTGSYVFGNANATNQLGAVGNAESFAAMYETGPLYLTLAYEKHDLATLGAGSMGSPLEAYTTTGLTGLSNNAYKFGVAYSIMATTVSALYEKSRDDFGLNSTNLLGHSTWYLSVKHEMGAFEFRAAYANATGISGTNSSGSQQYTLGPAYHFSKRTSIYALYTHILNQSNAAYNFADTVNPVTTDGTPGASIAGFSLGLKHSF